MTVTVGQMSFSGTGLKALGAAVAFATVLIAGEPQRSEAPRGAATLDGHCPVCIIEAHKWVPGKPEHQATFNGKKYYFPSEKEKQVFLADPAKYAPALGGDCAICYAKSGKRVPGNIQHGAFHDRRLYLFPSPKEQEEFLRHPEKYADADLALQGNCAVCLVHMNKKVPGKPAFTVIHDGLRYQFPSQKEQRMFQATPGKYAAKVAGKGQSAGAADTGATVNIKGKTACAACSHGVNPIGAKDTLGLAVETDDGKVYVVEDAHKKYPEIYEHRFDGLVVTVVGTVLRQNGKVTWIDPIRLARSE